ncbi:MAG: hypothetical protein K2K93_02415 [Muribaculaceae bacterium]|nr:hypothetical protein [Muribaculaceae bacterium]
MKKLHFISQAYVTMANATEKPSMDIDRILKKTGASDLGVGTLLVRFAKEKFFLSYLSYLMAKWRMPSDQIVILQFPFQYRIKQLYEHARAKGNKIIFLVHDIDELRGQNNRPYSYILQDADAVILHTGKMKKWYEEKYHPVNPPVVLGIFDYLLPGETVRPKEDPQADKASDDAGYKIVFAGNLGKSPFIYSLPESEKVSFYLYGPGIDAGRLSPHISYKGVVSPDEIISLLPAYDFGLVWDGDSINECSGAWGEYLKVNAPFKASSYLTSGIPVIVWDEMGLKDFVEANKVGISVKSLNEIPERLSQISAAEYAEMKENARAVSKKMRSGYYSGKAISEAVELLQ